MRDAFCVLERDARNVRDIVSRDTEIAQARVVHGGQLFAGKTILAPAVVGTGQGHVQLSFGGCGTIKSCRKKQRRPLGEEDRAGATWVIGDWEEEGRQSITAAYGRRRMPQRISELDGCAGDAGNVGALDADIREFAIRHASQFIAGLAILAPLRERTCDVHGHFLFPVHRGPRAR
jgi:hypothetical protein